MGTGVDAAIFGSGAVTYIAATGGGRRSTVPLTRGAGICGFPFASSFFLALFSLPCVWIPLALKKRRSNQKLEEISVVVMHNYTRNRRRKEGSLTHTFG